MKYISAVKWAKVLNIGEYEFNEYLEELGYLLRVDSISGNRNPKWRLTDKGMRHAKLPLIPVWKQFSWDFNAFFDVFKLKGEKTGEYTYCSSCGAYISAEYSNGSSQDTWKCIRCGHLEEKCA